MKAVMVMLKFKVSYTESEIRAGETLAIVVTRDARDKMIRMNEWAW